MEMNCKKYCVTSALSSGVEGAGPACSGITAHIQELSLEVLAVLISNQDASIVGFRPHAQLGQRVLDPSFKTSRLEDVSLDTRFGPSALSIGT